MRPPYGAQMGGLDPLTAAYSGVPFGSIYGGHPYGSIYGSTPSYGGFGGQGIPYGFTPSIPQGIPYGLSQVSPFTLSQVSPFAQSQVSPFAQSQVNPFTLSQASALWSTPWAQTPFTGFGSPFGMSPYASQGIPFGSLPYGGITPFGGISPGLFGLGQSGLTPGMTGASFYGAGFTGGEQLSDQDIEKQVEAVLDLDPLTCNAEIQVQCQDKVVTLTGTVVNRFAKQAAGKDAWSVPAVRDVNNTIEIKSRSQLGQKTGQRQTVGAGNR
jgi:hypothetical protein